MREKARKKLSKERVGFDVRDETVVEDDDHCTEVTSLSFDSGVVVAMGDAVLCRK
jgi:hypothetical protein